MDTNPNPMWVCYNTPFNWGTNDCVMMAANYLLATTGVDYSEGIRGSYTTAIGAYRVLSKEGGMEGLLAKHGFQQILPGFASTGDVVLWRMPKSGMTMGICNGAECVFAGGSTVPTSQVTLAFRKQ